MASLISQWVNNIHTGDVMDVLRRAPDASVHCIVTSPPYYSQRDYSIPTQIGSEKSPVEYVQRIQSVFSECRRVLTEDGTLWLNLGDKYQDGELLGLPWRTAFALKDDGWILRSDVIWHKPNAMPSSVKNRPTTDHEYIFMFAKNQGYYYDADSTREPHVTFSSQSRMKGGRRHFGKKMEHLKMARMKATQTCMTGGGTKPFTRKAEIAGLCGKFRFQSSAESTLQSFPKNWSNCAFPPDAHKTALF